MKDRQLIDFLGVMEKLKCNPRHCYTSSGRQESVAEHSWRAAVMAYLLKDEFPDTDISRVILMCLVHDWGEAVTGDIPSFSKTKADEQVEDGAVVSLLAMLPEDYRQELSELFAEMAARETKEAKLFKAIDHMEAIIAHNESDISTWLPLEYELNLTYGTDSTAFSSYLKELRETLREDTRRKIREAKQQD